LDLRIQINFDLSRQKFDASRSFEACFEHNSGIPKLKKNETASRQPTAKEDCRLITEGRD